MCFLLLGNCRFRLGMLALYLVFFTRKILARRSMGEPGRWGLGRKRERGVGKKRKLLVSLPPSCFFQFKHNNKIFCYEKEQNILLRTEKNRNFFKSYLCEAAKQIVFAKT